QVVFEAFVRVLHRLVLRVYGVCKIVVQRHTWSHGVQNTSSAVRPQFNWNFYDFQGMARLGGKFLTVKGDVSPV
ncbi:MAG TPA: hypothetical protein PKA76_09890, partial [Pirellulaceae bacterium]|nr:hypothetical protein [Pirellulaceae bacterium]